MSSGVYVFRFVAGALALDLINTVAEREGEAADRLTSAADARRWAEAAGLVGKDAPRFAPRDLVALREAREELHAVFRAIALGDTPSKAAFSALNARLRHSAGMRSLAWRGDGAEWILDPKAPAIERVLTPVLESAAELLVSQDTVRLKRCEDETCGWLFVDRSSTGRRRWCRMDDCGNRAKAKRHYRRSAG
jgi:predicted RNA-binding Zn ribbon-like protein